MTRLLFLFLFLFLLLTLLEPCSAASWLYDVPVKRHHKILNVSLEVDEKTKSFFPTLTPSHQILQCDEFRGEGEVCEDERQGFLWGGESGEGRLDSFLHRVRAAFGDQSLTRLSSRSGGKLFSVTAVLATLTKPLEERGVIAMSSTERFMWPSDHLNYTTLITTNGRTVGVRPLWQTPRVYEIIDFLSPFEVNHLIQIGELAKKDGSMFNSSVGGDHHVWNHAFRYSQQLWINPDFDDEISKRIRERAADVARLPVDLGEETQLLYYPQGGHYIGHLDAIKPKESNAYYDAGGNRIATFLYYLNTVEEGGETVFPRAKQQNFLNQDVCEGKDVESIGLRIKPQKGQVYMFYSLLEESHMQGKIDQTSYHTACPVKGESHKWLANQWIRNKRVNGRLFD